MHSLRDPILREQSSPEGIELSPLREPESMETPSFRVPSRATVMTSEELAERAVGHDG